MKYVLDSSVALKTVLPETDSTHAIQLLDDFHNAIHELIAPDVFHVEIGHALTRAERQGRIKPPDAWRLWRTVMADCPVLAPTMLLMPRAMALSSLARIGVDDCLYLALAEHEQCKVVTADQRLVNAFPAEVIPLSSL
ncbi:MAG: PIN domain-containing protein [Planctomycetaceae bacterium]|nr:PIN domain-containing protein [Planctomycetaceae bacterium]